jgi:D-3-phosphoglycerate dehydrogenase
VAEKAHAFGLRILATSRSRREAQAGIDWVDLDELLERSDFVSLHVPLNAETRNMIGTPQLARMKPTAYLINTARGGLVDHDALAAALTANRLAGAALDVQSPEPPDLTRPPYNDSRVIVTPHVAFVSEEAIAELRMRAAQQVGARLTGGTPENIVNLDVLPR